MACAILGKTLLFALLFITVCYGVLTFFADQSSLLENRPALVLGLLAAVLFFSLVFFVFRQICDTMTTVHSDCPHSYHAGISL